MSNKKRSLLDDDDAALAVPISVNKQYADRFEYNKRRQEMQDRMYMMCVVMAQCSTR